MITVNYVNGNLLTLAKKKKWSAIAHGCNCFCKMGKGVAYNIVRKYPSVKLADENTIQGDANKLGGFTYVQTSDGFYVFNLYTQYHYSNVNKVIQYPALRDALIRMVNRLSKLVPEGELIIGMPYIGSNNAGGTRKEFMDTLLETLSEYEGNRLITVNVVDYSPM